MRIRLALGVLSLAISMLAIVGIARACDQLGGSVTRLSPDPTGPGDPITYSISGMEKGATYRVTFNGQTMASGVSDGGGTNGSFSMPGLGDQPLTLYVTLYSDHSDDPYPWDQSFPVRYMPPAPSQPATAPAANHSSVPAEKTSAPRARRPPLPIAIAKHGAQKQRHDAASTGSGVGAAPADAVGSEPGPSNPSSGSGEVKRPTQESARAPRRVLDAIGSTTKIGPAKVPTLGLLAMAVIFILGTALAAFVIYLLRRGPDPDAAIKAPAPLGHDPVEVELQEMIAEEMARQLLSDLDLGEPSVSSR